jgi:parallel beta-helix repeat protein
MSIYPAHEHQPEAYCPGWKHGIKLEDCSKVIVKNNVIVNNSGNGVDIKNCRNITLEANLISKNAIGISLTKFQESSFNRDVSPLALENAGYSEVIAIENSVFENREQDYFVEEKSTLQKRGEHGC